MPTPVRMLLIGCGLMSRHHLRGILKQQDTTQIVALCEPDPRALAAASEIFTAAGLETPPNEPDLAKLIANYPADTAFIITPHAFHHDQTRDCLEAGLDVLLEKPMVMNGLEAQSLIDIQARTGRLLVVAFPASLSPYLRAALGMLRGGELGPVHSISATIWQNWGPFTQNTWRQDPPISGGGFFFDTGAHMLNTVVELAGEPFAEVSAWLDNRGRPVETMGVVIGRLESGALVTLHGSGEMGYPVCESDIRVFCRDAMLRTGMWAEFLEVQREGGKLTPVQVPPSLGVWEQFLAVREGRLPNPSPPAVGLRMARLYDAIKASAALGGAMVDCRAPLAAA